MKLILGLSSVLFIASGAVHAAGLAVNPGLWEVTTTMTGAGAEPQSKTEKTCIKDTEINPEKMMQNLPPDACQISTNIDGDTLSFEMKCAVEGSEMNGSGTMTVSGDTMSSKMDVSNSSQGQTMNISMSSEGKRLGDDC